MTNIKERLKSMNKRKASGLIICTAIVTISIVISMLQLLGYVGPLTKLLVITFFIILFIGAVLAGIDVMESRKETIDSIKK